jgi:CheY-like chemotaxis protein
MQSRKTLFIVDDDEDDQLLLHEAVTDLEMPIDFIYANNGELALRFLKEESFPIPDFIFLDLNMPKLNGKECLAEIKKLPKYAHVPVIIYTTSSRPIDIEETMELGASSFLTKPTRIGDLCGMLRDIFSTDWKTAIRRPAT